jgi:hypothetical protein
LRNIEVSEQKDARWYKDEQDVWRGVNVPNGRPGVIPLVTLPPALKPTYWLELAVARSRTRGLDGIGRRAEIVGSDMRHDASLASRVRDWPR